MENKFVFRRAHLNDIDSLSKLCEQTYREAFVEVFSINYPEKDPNSYLRSSASPEWFSEKILDQTRAVWVIEDKTNGELVAYAVAGPADQKDIPHDDLCSNVDGAIHCFFVRRDYQSHGFGKKLMNIILPWLEEHHPNKPIWLNVWSRNLKAQRFYTHYGFIKVGEAEFSMGEWKDHDFIMKRQPNHSV
ncbi:unnamed protein product [Rotaria sordida]|uniref:N-acetyltransferase domain-containing protein n=1 Tax=Rotaria sordida TaxID=392033 RepID=A0A815RGF9_9BILA|nr:unnamed protein product [Rotaria sordida]CAF4129078.1 unnamed protein product [Rotaria sordida]